MAEVSFFILGALFTFSLVVALLMLLGGGSPVGAAQARPKMAAEGMPPFRTTSTSGRPRTGRAPTSARPAPAQIAGPQARPSPPPPRPAETYRIAAALDEAERTLSRIARGPESAAAKIATQTLRRLTTAPEPPGARLAYARQRLELLSLRPDPLARLAARAALRAIA
jgi:hypothetical protein